MQILASGYIFALCDQQLNSEGSFMVNEHFSVFKVCSVMLNMAGGIIAMLTVVNVLTDTLVTVIVFTKF
jgi:hypothetical protein